MNRRYLLLLSLCWLCLLTACQAGGPAAPTGTAPSFFYLTPPRGNNPSLAFFDKPGAALRQNFPLNPPTDCTLFALQPAPRGRWIALEWDCAFGPAVELFDSTTGKGHFALSDPTIDSRYLAWQPDGAAIYLKIGTLSVPQTLRVDAETGQAVELSISPFAYDLTPSPDSKRLLFSLTKGIGFGSETWVAGPDGQNPSQLLVDGTNITALAVYSPDGSQIAFIRFPDSAKETPPGELWVMDSEGFHPRKLATADAGRGFAPVWSPDGTRIAFVGRATDNPAALTLGVYDLKADKLTITPTVPVTQPVWAPDGSGVAYSSASQTNAGSDTMDVWFYEISSGKVSKMVGGACCAGWIK